MPIFRKKMHLKMVTLNPAKMLHLDNQMGSIKVGKSADVVVWTDHPSFSLCKTRKNNYRW
jgi:imidazolonepropionase-like amidohydrolase